MTTSAISSLLLSLTTLLSGLSGTLSITPSTQVAQVASPSTLPLVQAGNISYVGSFRVPNPSGPTGDTGDANSFNGGGEAMSYNPANNTLILGGSRSVQPTTIAELNIPEIRQSSTVAGYATATYRQSHTVVAPNQADKGCGGPIGGSLLYGGRLIVSAYCYYDGGYIQIRSHWYGSPNFSTAGAFTGPVQIQSPASNTGGSAGFVAGYMTTIPTEWQALLGGPALTGLCCIPIITRTSWGPALSVFDPADVGVKTPVPATAVLGYPDAQHALDGDANCGATSRLFNCNTTVSAVIFPPGTRSVLFLGTQGTGEVCYGPGTRDPALHRTPDGEGGVFCYDPTGGSKGAHAYPYHAWVWAYDANDLVKVKNGQMQRWEVRPYATFDLPNLPFQVLAKGLTGAAYDATNRRIFVTGGTENDADGYKPLIHVLSLNMGAILPPPTNTATDATVSTWSAWTDTSSWGTCSAGTQTKTQQRTRTVITAATNGGYTPALSETQTLTQSCGTTSTTPATTTTPTTTQVSGTFSFLGKVGDLVGADDMATVPDGRTDGVFALKFNTNKTLTYLWVHESSNGSLWNTRFNDSNWILGISNSLGGSLLNATGLSVPVASGTVLYLYASDYNNSNFPTSAQYTFEAVFSDGTNLTGGASGTATAPTNTTPINAVLSEWSAWSATTAWSVCVSGSQSRTETRTRTVLQPATNGGTTGALSETRTVTQSCTSTTTPPSTKFTVGAAIQTTASVNVRSTASATGSLLGTQATGATGTVVGGAVAVDGYQWWNINYTNAPDGWSAENYLTQYVAPTPTTNKFVVGDQIKTTTKINVRSSAGGRRLGSQNRGAYGAIIGGPTTYQGYIWWKVDYTNAPDGWSIQDYLIKR